MLIYDTWVANVRSRLVAAGVAGGVVTAHRETPTDEEQLPACDVFIADDLGTEVSGGRTGTPMFVHTVKLGIEIRDADNSGPALRTKLHAEIERVFAALLATWPEWLVGGEGIAAIHCACDIPPPAGEVSGRALITIDLVARTIWSVSAAGLPALTTIAVDTGIAAGDTTIGATVPLDQ